MSSLVSSFSFWDWSQIVGTLLVVVGVMGELVLLIKKFRYNPTNFPPVESLKRKLEILSVVILLVGLVLEVIALPHSLLEVAKLEKSNLELQAKLQPRKITQKQINDFIFLTEKISKVPISVGIGELRDEPFNYAKQIRYMLNKAKFETPNLDTNFHEAVRNIPGLVFYDINEGETNEWTDLCFFYNSANSLDSYQFDKEETNGFTRPIVPESAIGDTNRIYATVAFAFRQMHLISEQDRKVELLSPGQCEVIIRQRPQ